MQFFTTSRRGQIAVAAGLLAGASSLMGFFDLWALALVGITAGLTVINLLIAENVHRGRLSAVASATREQQSLSGLNKSAARIEASLSELSTRVSKSSGTLPRTVNVSDSASGAAIAELTSSVESIRRAHDFQEWWNLHARLLKVAPQAATALALPSVLSRLSDGQTILFVGTAATASWAYETLIKRQITVGRAYVGFRNATEREDFEAFVAEKSHRLDHVSFVLDSEPLPAASMGGLPATAVDMMLIDFGASESHQDILASIPVHYWRWLREDTELIVLDSRQGLAAGATSSVLGHRKNFVVTIDSDDPYTRQLKRAAL